MAKTSKEISEQEQEIREDIDRYHAFLRNLRTEQPATNEGYPNQRYQNEINRLYRRMNDENDTMVNRQATESEINRLNRKMREADEGGTW